MPRVGQIKVLDGERLTDRIAIGVLTSMFPPTLIDEVLQTAGRVEQHHRLLPARVVVYLTLAISEISLPLATREFTYVISLKADAAAGGVPGAGPSEEEVSAYLRRAASSIFSWLNRVPS